ncbi:hypothetical protein V5799_033358 [Amblyomma americanum]|uniref:Uncharacterized protein n=1 Tax=Amblyomma americanum TaxID=6943 RepID=A0AAQ4DNJ3_AMBAM
MRNLTRTYRHFLKTGKTTGSGAISWPHFERLHSFLGSLPVNDPTLAQEYSCGGQSSVEHLIGQMVHGTSSTSSRTATPASDVFEASTEISRPQNLDSSTSEGNENTPPPQQPISSAAATIAQEEACHMCDRIPASSAHRAEAAERELRLVMLQRWYCESGSTSCRRRWSMS